MEEKKIRMVAGVKYLRVKTERKCRECSFKLHQGCALRVANISSLCKIGTQNFIYKEA